MDRELYDMLDNMTAEELMSAGEMLEELAENTALPEDTGSRIRASVLRKAGFEMKNTIRMNKGNTGRNITDSGKLNTVSRGRHVMAACIALAVIAATAGAVIFGAKLDTEPQKPLSQTSLDSSVTDSGEQKTVPEVSAAERKVQDWAKPYLEQNPETVGYLRIAGIKNGEDLETPVVQHEDNEFYGRRGFDKKPAEEGCAYADYRERIDKNGQPSNIILYGANTKDDTDKGFTPFLKYKDSEDFLKEHSVIDFSTVYDELGTQYQIFACFIVDLSFISENTPNPDYFDYWNYGNLDKDNFDRWIKEVDKRAIYRTDIDCTENDDYLTLAMINGAEDDFVIVAKKITNEAGNTDDSREQSEDGIFVPNVMGLTEEEAKKTLSDAGFVPVIKKVYSEDPEGKVMSTFPAAGEKLGKGCEVNCFVSRGYLEDDSVLPEIWGESEEEAERMLMEAGFVPERLEIFSDDPVGTAIGLEYDPAVDTIPAFGSKVKYYVSGYSETTENIPDYNKIVYEDDELKVTADKFMCDGNYFIMHLKEESKDGTPISEIHEKWGERLRYADSGEGVAYIKGHSEERYPADSTVGGAYLSWAVDSMTEGRELTVDLTSLKTNEGYKSGTRKEKVTRESFTLDTNLPTRTLRSENGLSLTLSPMGLSWSDGEKWVNKADGARDPFIECGYCYAYTIITKDGQHIPQMDFYRSISFGVGTGSVNGSIYYAYKDIDEIEAIELGGVTFR